MRIRAPRPRRQPAADKQEGNLIHVAIADPAVPGSHRCRQSPAANARVRRTHGCEAVQGPSENLNSPGSAHSGVHAGSGARSDAGSADGPQDRAASDPLGPDCRDRSPGGRRSYARLDTPGVVTGAVAFVSATQISTFRSLEGIGYSSTLTTANLRTLVTEIFEWRAGHELASRHHAALLAWIIAAFAVGAGVGGLCTRLIHQRAAWIAAAVLMIVLVVVVVETRRLDQRERPAPRPQKPQNRGA
jgi:hypothetical protein